MDRIISLLEEIQDECNWARAHDWSLETLTRMVWDIEAKVAQALVEAKD